MANTIKCLANGQMATATTAVMYTAPTAAGSSVVVKSLILVNVSGTGAQTVNLMYSPSSTAGATTRLIPKDLSLAAGYSLTFTPMVTLGAGDKLIGYSTNASATDYTISGVEITV